MNMLPFEIPGCCKDVHSDVTGQMCSSTIGEKSLPPTAVERKSEVLDKTDNVKTFKPIENLFINSDIAVHCYENSQYNDNLKCSTEMCKSGQSTEVFTQRVVHRIKDVESDEIILNNSESLRNGVQISLTMTDSTKLYEKENLRELEVINDESNSTENIRCINVARDKLVTQCDGLHSLPFEKILNTRRGSVLQRQTKIEKESSVSVEEVSAQNSVEENKPEYQSRVVNGTVKEKVLCGVKKREKCETFGRKIINRIIRSSSFNEKPTKKIELTTTKSLTHPTRTTLEGTKEFTSPSILPESVSQRGLHEYYADVQDEESDTIDIDATIHRTNLPASVSPNSLSQNGNASETVIIQQNCRKPRKLVFSNSVDICQIIPQPLMSAKSLSTDHNDSDFQPTPLTPSSSSNIKKSKYTSLNSIFSSGNLFEHFPVGGGSSVFSSNKKTGGGGFRSLSTNCDGSSSLAKVRDSNTAASLASLSSLATAVQESEDTVSKLPKFSRIRVPSSLNLVPSKSIKLSPKNCYRLVILGSSKVGKSSLIAR